MENSSIGSEISTKSARMRAKTLFEMLPKIKEAYTLICSLWQQVYRPGCC